MGFWKDLGESMFSSFGTGLGSGSASGILGYLFNSPSKQLRNSKKLMAYQSQLNKDLFDYQYQMELPSVRAAQLEAAGLHPGLMYSGAGVSGMNAQIGHSSPMPAPQLDMMSSSNPLASAQIENIKTNSRSQEEDIKLKRLDQIATELDNLRKQKELDKWDEKYQAEYDKLLAEQDDLRASIGLKESQTDLNKQERTWNSIINRYKLSEAKDTARMQELRRIYMENFNEEMPSSGLQSGIGDILHSFMGSDKPFDGHLGKIRSWLKEKFEDVKSKIKEAFHVDDSEALQLYNFGKAATEAIASIPENKRGKRW